MSWPASPEPRYTVEHQDWCHGVAHAHCCNLNSIEDDCDCGASEAQAEIDSLADTVRVQRELLDRIENHVAPFGGPTNGWIVQSMAQGVLDIIRTAR